MVRARRPDPLREIRQTGAMGVVTALHHLPTGAIWSVDEIRKRKDVYMYEVMKILILETKRRASTGDPGNRIPIRPDHGHLMAADRLKPDVYPGYSLFGRMRALSELRGLQAGIERSLNERSK